MKYSKYYNIYKKIKILYLFKKHFFFKPVNIIFNWVIELIIIFIIQIIEYDRIFFENWYVSIFNDYGSI